ncbi:MAG: cytochrome c [Pseudomonadota bacterium]
MKKPLLLLTALAVSASGAAIAQDLEGAINARKGQFRIMAYNLGVLGGMAKGEIDYDQATAQAAADNLVAVSSLNQMVHWPAGTDNVARQDTRALPKIWDNLDDVVAKWNAFGTAATGMQAAAGDGAQAIGGAIGAVGGTCKACHDAYRGPRL